VNPTLLADIAIKVIAVYLMARGISETPGIATFYQFSTSTINENNQFFLVMVGAIITPLIVGIVLWLLSNKIARAIVHDDVSNIEDFSSTAAQVQVVAIATIGLILLVLTLPRFVGLSIQLLEDINNIGGRGEFSINIFGAVVD